MSSVKILIACTSQQTMHAQCGSFDSITKQGWAFGLDFHTSMLTGVIGILIKKLLVIGC